MGVNERLKILEKVLFDSNTIELPKVKNAKNIIIYGVPGCGKSYYLENNYLNTSNYYKRVVFHSGYTNSDFIGQILPVLKNNQVSYQFKPGIFYRNFKICYRKSS